MPERAAAMTAELAEIRASLADLQRSTGRIEGKLESVNSAMEKAEADRRVQDAASKIVSAGVDDRMRKLEARQHWYAGAGSMLGMLLGWFGVHTIKP